MPPRSDEVPDHRACATSPRVREGCLREPEQVGRIVPVLTESRAAFLEQTPYGTAA